MPRELPDDLPAVEDLLAALFDEIAGPRVRAAAVAGGDISFNLVHDFGHVWNAVEQLADFLSHPQRIRGWIYDRFTFVNNHIESFGSWLWRNVSEGFRTGRGWTTASVVWLWDLTAQGLRSGRTWTTSSVVWLRDLTVPAINATFDRVGRVGPWVWDLVAEGLRTGRNWTTSSVVWLRDLLHPAINATFDRVGRVSGAVWDLVGPSLREILTRLPDAGGWLWDMISGGFSALLGAVGTTSSNVINFTRETGNAIIRETGNAVIAGAQGIGEFFQSGLEWLFSHVADPIRDAVATKLAIPRKLLTGQYRSAEELLDDFEDPLDPGSLFGWGMMIAGTPLALIGGLSEAGSVVFEGFVQEAAKTGGHTIPSFTDLRDGVLRGLLTQEKHDDWLGRAGYSADNISMINQLYFDLPTTSDMVRMAVREVFSPDVIERFGLFEEFPADFARFAKQIGISDEWARRHWGAHWDLPSITQGFQMFHRAVIDRSTLDLLLRTKDVMPFWRQKLTDIAFRVVSRIDIRRMFRLGVVDRARVLRTYLDLGYNPEDAEDLTEFVVRDATELDRTLPRETVVAAYRDRLLSRDQAVEELEALGFDSDQAEFFLDQVDLRIEHQLGALAEDIIERDVKSGAVGEASARAQLTELGVPAARIDLLLDLWSRQVAVKDRTLTPAQLGRLYRDGLIDRSGYRDRLSAAGYNERDIDLLEQLLPTEAQEVGRELTVAQLLRAFRLGTLNELTVRQRLDLLGFSDADVDTLVSIAEFVPEPAAKDLTVGQLSRAHADTIITTEFLRGRLARKGYVPGDIDILVALAPAEVTQA